MHVPVATTHVVGGSAIAGWGSVGSAGGGSSGGPWSAIAGWGSVGSADAGDGGGAIGGLGGMLLVVGSELAAGVAGGVARVGTVVATVVGFSTAVVGVRNASRTPNITTVAAAPANAIAAGLVRYHGCARMLNIQGATRTRIQGSTRRPPNMSSARGGASPCGGRPARACSASSRRSLSTVLSSDSSTFTIRR
jgi:hypothetical protein